MNDTCLCVIMAAGEGTRMKSAKPKVLQQVCGVSMIDHVLDVCPRGETPVVIVGHGREEVMAHVGDRARFCVQKEQKGTGHAVMMAREILAKHDGYTLVLAGDMPLLTREIVADLVQAAQGKAASLLSSVVDDATGYGRVLRDQNGHVTGIVEHKDATKEQRAVREINASVYCFDNAQLLSCLDALSCDNAQNEYYLTDCIGMLVQKGLPVAAVVADAASCSGVNDRVQLWQAESEMRMRINRAHMQSGVWMLDPAHTYIEPGVTIGRDTLIEGGVTLKGDTHIGENCRILGNTRIEDSTVADGCTVHSSVVVQSQVGEGTSVGPFAYLRPNSAVGAHCKIGDFVELKNVQVGDGSKLPHLIYAGDASIGRDCNIACGTIFANYDGMKKYHTTVEDHCFIGCNVTLVAPVKVEQGAFIAAGTTVTRTVPADSLTVARPETITKEGWAKKRRDEGRLK